MITIDEVNLEFDFSDPVLDDEFEAVSRDRCRFAAWMDAQGRADFLRFQTDAPEAEVRQAEARAEKIRRDLLRRAERRSRQPLSGSRPQVVTAAIARPRARSPHSHRVRAAITTSEGGDPDPHAPVLDLRAQVDPAQAGIVVRTLARLLVTQAVGELGLNRSWP